MENSLQRIKEYVKNLEWRRWKQTFLIFLLLTIIIFSIGSSTTMSMEESSSILDEIENQIPKDPTAQLIFENNFTISALMFIPIYGLVIGSLILYNTGLAFAATGTLPCIETNF